MANPEHLAVLKSGIREWNQWRQQLWPGRVDLRKAPLSTANLIEANLTEADLSEANLDGAILIEANLTRADLFRVDLTDAYLTGANLCKACLIDAKLNGAILLEAKLEGAILPKADLRDANLRSADLTRAYMRRVILSNADLTKAVLTEANLSEADLTEADLSQASLIEANLSKTNLSGKDLMGKDLTRVNLSGSNLSKTNLTQAILMGADLRSANLQRAVLDGAEITDARFWETQRAGWSIKGVVCKRAFWDKNTQEPTTYEPGEFERLHSDESCIELFYQGGVSKFELNTLPALLHHLAVRHPGTDIRLKSLEETGGGAKISISVGDSDEKTVEEIRSDAMQVYAAQLALRDNEILRLETEKNYLESFLSERLVKAMLAATVQQNVFNAPVYGVALSSGNSSAVVHQSVNDNTALLQLLENIIKRQDELSLNEAQSASLRAEVQSAQAELEKPDPNPTILFRSLKFVQKIATEAATKAAAKLGEQVISADWSGWMNQLNQFIARMR